MPNINERSSFVEDTGLLLESMGMTRMAGRIMGHLMVTDKEMVSFDELTQVLQASKSSISTNVKALINVSFIKPVTTPGDRKTYYMLSPDISWVEMFQRRHQQLIAMVNLFERGSKLRANTKDRTSQWIENAIDFYQWFIQRFPEIFLEWQEYKKSKTV
jgi:DNA-binding transcriptional regulator GbsR (MarR family)